MFVSLWTGLVFFGTDLAVEYQKSPTALRRKALGPSSVFQIGSLLQIFLLFGLWMKSAGILNKWLYT